MLRRHRNDEYDEAATTAWLNRIHDDPPAAPPLPPPPTVEEAAAALAPEILALDEGYTATANIRDALDLRLPIRADAPTPVFWRTVRSFPAVCHSRQCAAKLIDAETVRAARQAAEPQQRWITPLPPPPRVLEVAHS
jgi:hypothetical protein